MIIDAMTTAHRNEYFRNLLEHQRLTLESVTKQRDMLAEEIENLKAQLTRTQGAVTISRNGYVQELEQQLNEVRAERDALQEQLDAAIMLGKMQGRRHERELEQVREQYRLASAAERLLQP